MADRNMALFRLTGGEQGQAREESWRKRPVGLPEEVSAEEERAGTRKRDHVTPEKQSQQISGAGLVPSSE